MDLHTHPQNNTSTIYHHYLLVETLHHSQEMEQMILEYVNRWLTQCNRKSAEKPEEKHYITLMTFNNRSCQTMDGYDRLPIPATPVRSLPFDTDYGYYRHYACIGHTLCTVFEQHPTEKENGMPQTDVTIVSSGYDSSQDEESENALYERIKQKEKEGWQFRYTIISMDDSELQTDRNITSIFKGNIHLMASLTLRENALARKNAIAKDMTTNEQKAQAPSEPMMGLCMANHNEPFSINGVDYSNLKDFCQKDTLAQSPALVTGIRFHVYKNHKGHLILEYFRMYPCFDSYDYASEDRYHAAYWVCKDEEDLKRKYDFIKQFSAPNDDYSRVPQPAFMAPAVFYDSGYESMQIGY